MMIKPITKAEILASWNDAERKLECIIEREGDADGVRREDWYFIEILKEVISTKRQAAAINKKGIKLLPDATNEKQYEIVVNAIIA